LVKKINRVPAKEIYLATHFTLASIKIMSQQAHTIVESGKKKTASRGKVAY